MVRRFEKEHNEKEHNEKVPMERKQVESSNLRSVGYDPETEILEGDRVSIG